jgi:hypothetical protein
LFRSLIKIFTDNCNNFAEQLEKHPQNLGFVCLVKLKTQNKIPNQKATNPKNKKLYKLFKNPFFGMWELACPNQKSIKSL